MFKSNHEEVMTEMSAREALLLACYLSIQPLNSESSVKRAALFSLKWHLLAWEFGKMRGLGCALAAA